MEMIDRKEIIRGLDAMREFFGYGLQSQHPTFMKYQEILTDTIVLMKEQEAKPINYVDNPYTGLPVAHCPKCGKFARQFHAGEEEETHYCPWCGQELNWK